jgi:Cu-Zn family superoxide dismutase
MRLLPIVMLLCGCTSRAVAPGATPASAASAAGTVTATGPLASAAIEPRSGSALIGTATFKAVEGGGVAAHVEVQNAPPGLHGVHIHEKGDCSDPKAASAGAHYNPNGGPHHGGPATPVRHGGDLGNLTADDSGKGVLDVVVQGVSLDNAIDGVVGRAIVVHEKADDLQTDPSGNSGGRIGCGVIRAPLLQ